MRTEFDPSRIPPRKELGSGNSTPDTIKIRRRRGPIRLLHAAEDAVGDGIVHLIKRIPQMRERSSVIEANPHENPYKKDHLPKWARTILRASGEGVKHGWNVVLGDRIKRGQERKLTKLLEHPERNRNDVKRELTFAFREATGRTLLTRIALNVKRFVQFPGLLLDHAPLAIPRRFLPLLPFIIPVISHFPPLLHFFPEFAQGTPIFLSSMAIALLFNIPNAIHAFIERRHKKALYELLVLTPLAVVVPFGAIDNSWWQETLLFRPREFRRNRRFVNELDTMLSDDTKEHATARNVYESNFNQLIQGKYGRKRDSAVTASQRALPHLDEKKIEYKEDIDRNHKGIANQRIILDYLTLYWQNFGRENLNPFIKIPTMPITFLLTLIPKLILHAGLKLSEADERINEYRIETLNILNRLITGKANGHSTQTTSLKTA